MPRIDAALDDDAVDGGADHGAVEIYLGLRQLCFALFDHGLAVFGLRLGHDQLRAGALDLLLRAVVQRHRLVAIGSRDEILFKQYKLAVKVALGIGKSDLLLGQYRPLRANRRHLRQHRGPARLKVCRRLAHLQLEGLRVDARNDLVLFDR